MLRDAILRAESLADRLGREPEIELLAQVIQTASFRYIPSDLDSSRTDPSVAFYLDLLNQRLAVELDQTTDLTVSERTLHGSVVICVAVLHRATDRDGLARVAPIVRRRGNRLDSSYRCRIDSEGHAGKASSSWSSSPAAVRSGRS